MSEDTEMEATLAERQRHTGGAGPVNVLGIKLGVSRASRRAARRRHARRRRPMTALGNKPQSKSVSCSGSSTSELRADFLHEGANSAAVGRRASR